MDIDMTKEQVAEWVGHTASRLVGEDHGNRVTANMVNGLYVRASQEALKFFTEQENATIRKASESGTPEPEKAA